MSGILVSLGTFLSIGAIPYYSPIIVEWLQFGIMGNWIANYVVPLLLNWVVNFTSDYMYIYQNCKGEFKTSTRAIASSSLIPGIMALIFSLVLNFIPILKLPLLIFAIGGAGWIVETVINLIANYIFAQPTTWSARMSMLKNSCKKSEKKSEK